MIARAGLYDADTEKGVRTIPEVFVAGDVAFMTGIFFGVLLNESCVVVNSCMFGKFDSY